VIENKSVLAIIPARGGSERLPGKNILDLLGKPLISWTIESALDSKYIDRVIVSTDDSEIASVAKKYNADVPFMRPANLASNYTKSIDVVLHAIIELQKTGKEYDYIIFLQPTSPLRSVKNIDESIELLQYKKCDSVISVCEAEHSPLWCNKIPSNDSLLNFLEESAVNTRSQDLEKYYRLNGAIYLCKVKKILDEKTFFLQDNIFSYKMSQDNSIDIDTKLDLQIAMCLLKGEK
jgi:CMP-N-acetylneuraminic acid synthetase